jgi:1D-myo-inositol 3-kinase
MYQALEEVAVSPLPLRKGEGPARIFDMRRAPFVDDRWTCPSYLAIGHITKDIAPGGYLVGGSLAYAAGIARNLGETLGGVTSFAPDFQLPSALMGVDVIAVPSVATTTFENVYVGQGRQQFIRSVASHIETHSIPSAWLASGIVHLAPVAQEVSPTIAELFPQSFIGITPQGWMRRWSASGRVFKAPWRNAARMLRLASAVVLSIEDVLGGERTIAGYARQTRVLVATRGADGADLYYDGAVHHFRSWPAREVDPTGAGDVFAAAFFIQLQRSGDPFQAMHFATCAGSTAVERIGLEGIPTLDSLNRRLRQIK